MTALPSAVRARVRALAADLEAALQLDKARARDVLRAMFGRIVLVQDGDAVYAEFDDAAESLILAIGGASLGRVAGARNRTRLRVR